MKYTITLTEAQELALLLEAKDIPEFIDNWVFSRIGIVEENIKKEPWYTDALLGVINDGGDPKNPLTTLAKAREMGLVETAEERDIRLKTEFEQTLPE